IVLLSAALAACSVEYIYNRADRFILDMVDEHFDLDRSQESWVRTQLEAHLANHRAEELPRYREFLQEASDKFLDGFREQDYEPYLLKILELRDRLMGQLTPDALTFLATVTPEQIDNLRREFTKRDQEIRDEYLDLTPERRLRRQIERQEEFVERWLGSVSESQHELISRELGSMPQASELWHTDRMQRQQNLILALQEGDRARIEGALKRLAMPQLSEFSPELQATILKRRPYFARIYAGLSQTMTASQREHLRNRVDTLLETMHRLAKAS
uniref:DUF6279 family lipoprotein n=1 Tax=Sedimenticola sp. TaxID=1940285 RepID=UPI003D10F347